MNFGDAHEVYLRLLMDGGFIDATVIGVDAVADSSAIPVAREVGTVTP